jgi:hypothetical protein
MIEKYFCSWVSVFFILKIKKHSKLQEVMKINRDIINDATSTMQNINTELFIFWATKNNQYDKICRLQNIHTLCRIQSI